MVPPIRSRRVVSNDGPHLFVIYDLTCAIPMYVLCKLCSQTIVFNKALTYMYEAVDGTIHQISIVSKGGPLLSVAHMLTCGVARKHPLLM